ncbi:methylmalonyl Co-A mutase-associated GTPase MeaB [bacterium]|nr:methylmalonyl Co-A mutase-associated GTPase MeaB [bacterium]
MTINNRIDELIIDYSKGSRRALSRLISIVENDSSLRPAVTEKVHPFLQGAYRIGLTGPPGGGKSTLVSVLAKLFRQAGKKVGVAAVDPTSPFTGGALLGDRVRMNAISLDPGIYIRSLATRGALGGLAAAIEDVVDLMDGFGCQVILIETVGVGQAELDIVSSADTTIVVLVPESGDSIQAMKAGMMEIGDIFVLNKSDRQGADHALLEIRSALKYRKPDIWTPPILKTAASLSEGIEDLHEVIEKHLCHLKENGLLIKRQYQRRKMKIRRIVQAKLEQDFWDEERKARLDRIAGEDIPVFSASEKLISE